MLHLTTGRRNRLFLACTLCLLCWSAQASASEPSPEPEVPGLESDVVLPPGLWDDSDDSAAGSEVSELEASGLETNEEPQAESLDDDVVAPAPSTALAIPPPLDPPPLTEVSVMLDWYLSPQHAALLIADERELFEEQGLTLDLQSPADPDVALKLLVAEEVDLALTREPVLHLQVHAGEPLVRVGTLIETPLNAVVVTRQAAEQEDIAALAGLDYGFSTLEGKEIVAERLIPQSLRQTDSFKAPVNVHFDAVAAVVGGEAQVIADGFYTTLPQQLAPEGVDSRVIHYETIDIPRHDGLIVVANSHSLASKGPIWARFLTAVEQASHWMIENPEAAWALLVEHHPILDNPANEASWEALLRRLSLSPAAVNTRRYQAFEAYLAKRGIIEAPLPVSRLAIDPHTLTP
ncbi:ABC transporter substrate-binding protein [Halomonas sp. HNIBRBA4712]|uniref:ABC transporter substrate-binding protein n=1 Tax=Halomonas sp. HNIBRBA4712 TaxID=3373087 RepID=UPI003746D03D